LIFYPRVTTNITFLYQVCVAYTWTESYELWGAKNFVWLIRKY